MRAELPAELDAIVLGDVLEHLRDPWAALTALAGLLSPSGRIVLSLPNIAVWNARRELARGRFPYADHGVFDRTHLRFFTRTGAHALARDAGLAVRREQFAPAALPLETALRRLTEIEETDPPRALSALRERAASARPELFALQFVLTCTRP